MRNRERGQTMAACESSLSAMFVLLLVAVFDAGPNTANGSADPDASGASDPHFSPSGKRIVFGHWPGFGRDAELTSIRVDGQANTSPRLHRAPVLGAPALTTGRNRQALEEETM